MGEEAQQSRGKGCDADCVVCEWIADSINGKEMRTAAEWIFLREMVAQHIEDELSDKKKKTTYESKNQKAKKKRTDSL